MQQFRFTDANTIVCLLNNLLQDLTLLQDLVLLQKHYFWHKSHCDLHPLLGTHSLHIEPDSNSPSLHTEEQLQQHVLRSDFPTTMSEVSMTRERLELGFNSLEASNELVQ